MGLVGSESFEERLSEFFPSAYAPGWDPVEPSLGSELQDRCKEYALGQVIVVVDKANLLKIVDMLLWITHSIKGFKVVMF